MPKYLLLEVSLTGIKPKIWRRLLLKSTANFGALHDTIQAACGREDYHLFQFEATSGGGGSRGQTSRRGSWKRSRCPLPAG